MPKLTPESMRGYRPAWLSRDVIAGVTLAAVAIPETMGYTSIAQTPVVTGLYTVIFPTIVFALLGSSRLLVVGADSATAAILAAGLAGIGIAGLQPDSAEWVAWTSLVALVCGGLLVLARLLKLGFLGDFLSAAVLIGFLTGVGIQVFSGQVPGMLGIPKGSGNWFEQQWWTITHVSDADVWTVGFAAGTLVLIVGFKRFAPKVPGAVIAVVLSIIVSRDPRRRVARRGRRRRRAGRVPAHRPARRDHVGRRAQGPRHRVLLLRPDRRPERRDVPQLRHEARASGST